MKKREKPYADIRFRALKNIGIHSLNLCVAAGEAKSQIGTGVD